MRCCAGALASRLSKMNNGGGADREVSLEVDGLRVVFYRSGDRYAHRVETLDAERGTWNAEWESREGPADEPWPPSPALQQLHVEDRPTGRVLLLVGMGGRTHWSAAVEAAADGRSIEFDVAARVHESPVRLGSEYAASGEPDLHRGSGKRTARVRPTGSSNSGDRDGRIVVALPSKVPATVSWRYVVEREALCR